MGQQTIRQAARRAAFDAQARRRRERAERERRIGGLAVQVMTALGERDAAVAWAERRAGAALVAMCDEQGLTLRETAEWCGGLSVREVTRLRKLAEVRADDAHAGDRQAGGAQGADALGGDDAAGERDGVDAETAAE